MHAPADNSKFAACTMLYRVETEYSANSESTHTLFIQTSMALAQTGRKDSYIN